MEFGMARGIAFDTACNMEHGTEVPDDKCIGYNTTYLSVSSHRGVARVMWRDIRCFVAAEKCVTVRYVGGEMFVNQSLCALERGFAGRLRRVNRNALVSVRHIHGLRRNAQGEFWLSVQGLEGELKVSRRHAGPLRKLLQQQ